MDNSEVILSNIFNRKSVRNFTDKKVDKADLLTIIKAGMSAPSALNLQPWEFIVFDDMKTIDWMVNLHDYSKMFKTATAGIVVCGNMDKTIEGFEDFWIQDCSAATQNILLAIEALNLGGVWLGIYPIEERCNKLIEYYNLPLNIVPFAVIALGHPSNVEKSKNKWDDKKLHWNKW
ncbi:nitroreductase family protein [Methanosphaera sp.]